MSDAPENKPAEPSSPPPAYTGAMAGIAKRHEEIRSESDLKLVVPGFEGRMKIQYRLLPEPEMDRLAQRIEDTARGQTGVTASLEVDAGMLVDMCDRIWIREPGAEDYQVLEDETGPVRFERRFAAIMKKAGAEIDDRRAKEVVLDFFSPRKNPDDPTSPRHQPQAMETHTNAILLWHRGEKESISRRLLGE
jgi:hypothetical protein